jgi:hypothetical protein
VCIIAIANFGLKAERVHAQVISFDGTRVLQIEKNEQTPVFQKKGFTSYLISEPGYSHVQRKFKWLKKNLSRSKKLKQADMVGDIRTFFVRDVLTGSTWYTADAVLGLTGSTINIWIQKSAFDTLSGTSTWDDIKNAFKEALLNSTPENSVDPEKGVLDILNQYVGDFPNVDGDGILDVLLLDIQDRFNETGSYVAGFFDPVNLYDVEYSNQRDLIYLDLYPTILFNDEVHVERAVSTFAHESQHLIHAGYEGKEPELVFVNEGFSEAVEILCGFEPRSTKEFQARPLRGLLQWDYENPLADYARASLWTHYVLEQIGLSNLKKLVQSKAIGVRGYREVIEEVSPYTFEQVFRNWGLALMLNDRSQYPEYGYRHPLRQQPHQIAKLTSSLLPLAFEGVLPSLVNVPICFPLTKTLDLKTGKSSSANTWISALSNYPATDASEVMTKEQSHIKISAERHIYGSIQTVLTNFGDAVNTGNQAISFLGDGELSGRILERGYGDGNPDAFYQNASYLALNGIAQKIGVVFPPTASTHWLKALSIRTLFKSELEGAGIKEGAPRDFNVDIYRFKMGQPENKIIPGITFRVQRELGQLIPEVFPLSRYYSQLSAIQDSIIVIIGNDEDDDNYIALAMDKGTENASYFSESANNKDEWVSLSKKSIGASSLSTWNPIVQEHIVLPEITKIETQAIKEITYSFKEVQVRVVPDQEYDTLSMQVVAKLPDGNFSNGKLLSIENGALIFAFPVLVNGSYAFTARYATADGARIYSDEKEWSIDIPDGIEISTNYPNPFNPTTTITFALLEKATIQWQVFDVLGRVVMQSPAEVFLSGEHRQVFNLHGLASGLYIVRTKMERARSENTIFRTQKIMLIK